MWKPFSELGSKVASKSEHEFGIHLYSFEPDFISMLSQLEAVVCNDGFRYFRRFGRSSLIKPLGEGKESMFSFKGYDVVCGLESFGCWTSYVAQPSSRLPLEFAKTRVNKVGLFTSYEDALAYRGLITETLNDETGYRMPYVIKLKSLSKS